MTSVKELEAEIVKFDCVDLIPAIIILMNKRFGMNLRSTATTVLGQITQLSLENRNLALSNDAIPALVEVRTMMK